VSTQPDSFSFGSAYAALEDLITAIPKTRRGNYVGHFNELGVVLTGAAGLLGVVRDSEQWNTEIGKLPRPPQVAP
jgi:hypothetical protein